MPSIKTIESQMRQIISSLPRNADEIAAKLKADGWRSRAFPNGDPLAKMIRHLIVPRPDAIDYFTRAAVNLEIICLFEGDCARIQARVTAHQPVLDFIKRWENGEFPELVLPEI